MKKSLLFFLFAVLIFSCKKKEQTPVSPVLPDQLSTDQLQAMEVAGIDTLSTFNDAKFADGSSMNDWLQNNSIQSKAIYSIDAKGDSVTNSEIDINPTSDEKQLFLAIMTEIGVGLVKPTNIYSGQKKIAYVYGSRKLTAASVYLGATCQEPKYGLDCSGMIYQMAYEGSLNIVPGGTNDYINVQLWNNAFKNSTYYKNLQMMDMKALPVAQIEAGDMIISPGVHMGMVFYNGLHKEILNSLGSPDYSCDVNSDSKHGPVITNDISGWLVEHFGTNYHVLRAVLKGSPGLTTSPISSVSSGSAVSGGDITNDGGSAVTSKGVCWNTTGLPPAISDNKTSDGTGTGAFTSNITGLTSNTTYYVRAYATNSSGTAYGKVLKFTTNSSGSGGSSYYITYNVDGSAVTFAQDQIRSGGSYYTGSEYVTTIVDNITDINFLTDGTNLEFALESAKPVVAKTYNITSTGTDGVLSFAWEYQNQSNFADYSYTGASTNASATVTISVITSTSIQGTFSATLVNSISPTNTVTITNGKFYLPYTP